MSLPQPDEAVFWQSIHGQPLDFWQSVLETICQRHGLSVRGWQRAPAGKNLVFLADAQVIKLCPPFWLDDIHAEAKTVAGLEGRLPVATPQLLAEGDIDGWYYLVLSRLPGQLLRTLWKALTPGDKISLAHQHGQLMAALHQIPVQDFAHLAFDWTDMLEWQFAHCDEGLQHAGVSVALLADVAAYVSPMMPVLLAEPQTVVLHGDLDAVNMLVEQRDGHWHISGLFDLGDAKIGPYTHEFISPCVHSYQGDRAAMQAWYAGYGLPPDRQTRSLQHNLMVRTVLYYAPEMMRYLNAVPGALACTTWHDAEACFYHFAGE